MHHALTEESALPGVKALIVEDEKIVAFDVESLLHDFGAEQVLLAATVAQTRRILAGHPDVSIVLLDLKLMDGSGEELIPDLIASGIPFVITTGYSTYANAQAPVIYKPYSAAELLRVMRGALGSTSPRRQGVICHAASLSPFSRI